MHRNSLSTDEWFSIIKNLPVSDVINILSIYTELDSEDIWLYLLDRDYPRYRQKENESYKDTYKRYYIFEGKLHDVYIRVKNMIHNKDISIPDVYDYVVYICKQSRDMMSIYGITLDAIIVIIEVILLDRELLYELFFILYHSLRTSILDSFHVRIAMEDLSDTENDIKIYNNIDKMGVKYMFSEISNPNILKIIRKYYNSSDDLDGLTKEILELSKGDNTIIFVKDDTVHYLSVEYNISIITEFLNASRVEDIDKDLVMSIRIDAITTDIFILLEDLTDRYVLNIKDE
jgi:hypothetical protein